MFGFVRRFRAETGAQTEALNVKAVVPKIPTVLWHVIPCCFKGSRRFGDHFATYFYWYVA
jgi:hypothetical protein